MSSQGKRSDPNYRPLASIRQHIDNGDLFLGFSFGRGVDVKRGTEDWEDLMELLTDLSPNGVLQPNINDLEGIRNANS